MKWPSRMAPASRKIAITSASVMRPSSLSAFTRVTALTTGRARSCAMSAWQGVWRRRPRRRSTMAEKSAAPWSMRRLEMLPSLSAITWAIWASVPGSLIAVTSIRAGKPLVPLVLDVPAHVEPALGLVVEGLQRRRLDGVDGDALSRREDADDAVARHGAAFGEAHRHVALVRPRIGMARSSAPAPLPRCGFPREARHPELEAAHASEAEPALLARLSAGGDGRSSLWSG